MSLQGLFAKMYIFWGQNGLLGAKIAIIGPNILFFFERDQKCWYPHIRKPLRPLGTKLYNFDPKMLILGDKSHFCFRITISFRGHITSPVHPGLQLSRWTHPEKNLFSGYSSFSAAQLRTICWIHPDISFCFRVRA